MRPEDVVGTLDQKASEIDVASIDDAKLRISFAGLDASWPQAEIAAHITTSSEAFLVAERENEGQSGDVPDTVHLQQSLGLWIRGLCQLLDLAIIVLDLGRHLRDLHEHRAKRLLKTRRHDRETPFSEAPR